MKTNKEGKFNDQRLENGPYNDLLSSSELDEVNDILNQWKTREVTEPGDSGNNLYITAYDIKDNDYKLNFNDYKIIQKSRQVSKKTGNTNDTKNPIVATKKEHLDHFFEDSIPVQKRSRGEKYFLLSFLY